jgi:Resolvase, N terminal domain
MAAWTWRRSLATASDSALRAMAIYRFCSNLATGGHPCRYLKLRDGPGTRSVYHPCHPVGPRRRSGRNQGSATDRDRSRPRYPLRRSTVRAQRQMGDASRVPAMAELQPYDLLVVTRLNRLGRTTAEVLDTVKQLEWKNVHLRCLELGDHRAGLTRIAGGISEHGTLIMQTSMAACVKLECQERDRRRNARTQDKRQGRPPRLSANKRREAMDRLAVPGTPVATVAKVMGCDPATIYRTTKAAYGPEYHPALAARRAGIARSRNLL